MFYLTRGEIQGTKGCKHWTSACQHINLNKHTQNSFSTRTEINSTILAGYSLSGLINISKTTWLPTAPNLTLRLYELVTCVRTARPSGETLWPHSTLLYFVTLHKLHVQACCTKTNSNKRQNPLSSQMQHKLSCTQFSMQTHCLLHNIAFAKQFPSHLLDSVDVHFTISLRINHQKIHLHTVLHLSVRWLERTKCHFEKEMRQHTVREHRADLWHSWESHYIPQGVLQRSQLFNVIIKAHESDPRLRSTLLFFAST